MNVSPHVFIMSVVILCVSNLGTSTHTYKYLILRIPFMVKI